VRAELLSHPTCTFHAVVISDLRLVSFHRMRGSIAAQHNRDDACRILFAADLMKVRSCSLYAMWQF